MIGFASLVKELAQIKERDGRKKYVPFLNNSFHTCTSTRFDHKRVEGTLVKIDKVKEKED